MGIVDLLKNHTIINKVALKSNNRSIILLKLKNLSLSNISANTPVIIGIKPNAIEIMPEAKFCEA